MILQLSDNFKKTSEHWQIILSILTKPEYVTRVQKQMFQPFVTKKSIYLKIYL